MIWVAIIISVLIALESTYCYARKKKSKVNAEPVGIVGSGKVEKQKRLINRIVVFANDVTFLLFKIVGYIPSHIIRKLFYKFVFHMTLATGVTIYYGLEARSPWNIEIGENSNIGDHAILDARFGISVGSNVNLSSGVWIWTLQHDVNSLSFGTEGQGGKVVIKDRAWVSSRTSILPGSIIEEGVVIACGAVVASKETKPFCVYGGVPAKEIAKRNPHIDYKLGTKHRWFL